MCASTSTCTAISSHARRLPFFDLRTGPHLGLCRSRRGNAASGSERGAAAVGGGTAMALRSILARTGVRGYHCGPDTTPMTTAGAAPLHDFIRDRIRDDLAAGKVAQVVTRFPPEPNGYLHIGHAKAICLSFGVAQEFGGRCHLRMDDTNPAAEDQEYVDAIMADVRWLGFEWDALYYAADYFDQLYAWAELLVQKGLAYVDDQDADTIARNRGTLNAPGTDSPCRSR